MFQGMDIRDIDIVIVYGVPEGMNLLYQVACAHIHVNNDYQLLC